MHNNINKLTYLKVKQELKALGISINRSHGQSGEYRVNPIGGTESTAYYATDLDDALATGKSMAERASKEPQPATRNLAAVLANNGFVQNVNKSTGIFSFWERGPITAITSIHGYLIELTSSSLGGCTEAQLTEHLAYISPAKTKETMQELAVEAAGRVLINVEQGQAINYPRSAIVVAGIWEIEHTLRNEGYAMGTLTFKNVVEEIVTGFQTHGDKYLMQAALRIHDNMRALTDLELRAER